MEANKNVHNLCAALVSDPRYNELRLALYDNNNISTSSIDSTEGYGAFIGLVKSFERIDEWAKEGKSVKLKEFVATHKEAEQLPREEYADPDMMR